MFGLRKISLIGVFALIAVSFVPVLSVSPAVSPAHAEFQKTFTGTITSGSDYKLHTVDLGAGQSVTATLVCAEIAPGNRPLDPVLTVFFPGSDPTNYGDYDLYDDDGLKSVPCNAWWSSTVSFTTTVSGTYTFRADGFSTSTGPYILTVSDTTAAGCDVMMALPATAVVGSFVADATLYSEPGNPITPALTMQAGKTAWVLGVDASGQYYKILWVCSYVWVPKDTMGPNYDDVWEGTPLPTDVVSTPGK